MDRVQALGRAGSVRAVRRVPMDRVRALGRAGLVRAWWSPLWTGSGLRAGRALSGHDGVPCGQGPGPGQGGLGQGGGGGSGCRQPGLVLVSTGPQRNGKTILGFSEEFVIHVTQCQERSAGSETPGLDSGCRLYAPSPESSPLCHLFVRVCVTAGRRQP